MSTQASSSYSFLHRLGKFGLFAERVISFFDNVDPDYIEKIPYNFTIMLQATNNFERYTVGTQDYAERLTLAQKPDLRVGPYFGWRFLFLGYTFDVTNIGGSRTSSTRFEYSLYTSLLGCDLMYRKTGSDFKLRYVEGLGDSSHDYEGQYMSFLSTRVLGVNLYYVFNHRKFSLPAVFSQTTIQRRSAGSWLLGANITSHRLDFDYMNMPVELFAETEIHNQFSALERVKYMDFSVNFGYAYNWAFARNWCLGVYLTPAIGYKYTSTQTAILGSGVGEQMEKPSKLDEIFNKKGNINIDATARLGIVYNNGRWFVGTFGVLHNYNYKHSGLRFNNTFGTINLCGGFFFSRIKGM